MGMPFMKFYPLDFISDPLVEMLSMAARGCYITLLCKLWMANEPYLPNDLVKLARLTGLSVKEFTQHWEEIQQPGSEIFTIIEQNGAEVITQKRLLKEWSAVDEIGETRRVAASRSHTKRLQNNSKTVANDLQNVNKTLAKDLQTTLQNVSKTFANELQNDSKTDCKMLANDDRYSDTQIFRSSDTQIQDIQTPDSRETSFAPEGAASVSIAVKSTDLCPHKAIIDLYHEVLPELPRVKEWEAPRQTLLRNQWKKSGRNSLEYWRAYFELVRQSSFLLGMSERQDGKTPFVASLEWLIRPKNMPKVLEGNYTDRDPRNGPANRGKAKPGAHPSIGDHFRAMADEILAEAGTGQVIDITDLDTVGENGDG